MPKIQKKPKKKAAPRAVNGKPQRTAPVVKAAKSAPRRSVPRAAKATLKRAAPASTKSPKRAVTKRAVTKRAVTKRSASKQPPRAAVQAPAKARARRISTLILPPKPHRKTGRIAPPPPRTPHAVEALIDHGLELDQPAPVSSVASIAPRAASLVCLREAGARPRVTQDTWRQLQLAAGPLQRAELGLDQRTAIRAGLEGRDSLVVIPNDDQAVLCYQLCAALLEQPTVVLSPVAAELRAQAEALSEQRKPVVCLLAEHSGPERSAALGRIARGGSLLVLLDPETLLAADVQKALAKSGISLFVAEEAQCASELAHEIRPSYGALGQTLRALGKPPVMALTRCASAEVLRDIAVRLELADPVIVQAPVVRENQRIVTLVTRGDQRQAALVRLIERLEPPGLVFCASAHDVDSVYAALRGSSSHISAHRYHSAMTPEDRAAELLDFTLPGSRGVMVALSAFAPGSGLPGLGEPASGAALGFGRGTGKRSLRFVVHYQSPASIEQYLREVQRAGSDGQSATCVLFHESGHRSLHEVMLAQQRFRPAHLAELGRALETPTLEGRTVTLEALALTTGQSRRTTDRLAALLADAGVVSKTGGWVRVLCSASALADACRELGAKLYALREQDARRLSAVSAFAETGDCKAGYIARYLGQRTEEPCGRCSTCSPEPAANEATPAHGGGRRPMVHEFSVQAVAPAASPRPTESGAFLTGAAALTAKPADFGAATPRAGR